MIFDGATTVHRVQYYPYDMLDLVSYGAAGVGSTKLRAGPYSTLPQQMLGAPGWFPYFSRDKLPNESDSVYAPLMKLTLSTIGNQVWSGWENLGGIRAPKNHSGKGT